MKEESVLRRALWILMDVRMIVVGESVFTSPVWTNI